MATITRRQKLTKREIEGNRYLQTLRQWGHVMFCVSGADYYLHRAETLPIKKNMDNVMEVDAFLLSFSITYGRMFTNAANGFPKLDPNRIYLDENLRAIHDRIMELRHSRYAHEGGGADIEFNLAVSFKSGGLTVKPEIRFGVPGHQFVEFRKAVTRLQAYVHERIFKLVEKASETLGVEVEFPSGPPPEWAIEPT